MRRGTKVILGITIAILTAASLHFTVGNRFHGVGFGPYGPRVYGPCGYGNSRKSGLDLNGHEGKAPMNPQPLNPSQK